MWLVVAKLIVCRTVNDVAAHVNLIRRDSSEEDSPVGYFIELPRDTSVTVNGTTYTNSDGSSSMPFYIGPLEGYAIIELLSQPAFFFRTAASLKDTSSHRAVPQEELDRRDGNGDVALGNTRVRWGPVGAPLPPVGSGNPDVQEEVEEESEDDFIDTFTDEGEPIKDLGAYIRAQLLSHQQSRYRELIPRVLASVNYRQKEATGFSYQHEGQTFRSGRTLLQPIEKDGNHLLLAAQIHTDKHITLEVLDPMTWRSTLSSRKAIDEHIRETLRSSTWWRHVFDSLDQMEENLPKATMWVPAAQVTTGDGSFTYTVLNAWALAMGLALNPSFTLSAHGHESFFIRAQQIFDLALQDTLNWRVLLACFRCTGFVKPSEGSENDEEANLPDLSRRFDLCNRSFQKLIARQTAADAAAEGKKIDIELVTLGLEDGMRHDLAFAADSLSELEQTNLTSIVRDGQWNFKMAGDQPDDGLNESDLFLSPPNPHLDTDPAPRDFEPCVHLREQLKTLIDANLIATSIEGEEAGANIPQLSESEVTNGIKAVMRSVNDLLSSNHGFSFAEFAGTVSFSGTQGDRNRVVLVSHQHEGHFILVVLQYELKASASEARKGDAIESEVDKSRPDKGKTGKSKDSEYVAVTRVIDSAPWTMTTDERAKIHEQLKSSGLLTAEKEEFPDNEILTLKWIDGPQQTRIETSGYFTIISAWAVLLGLPINNDFHPKEDFFSQASHLIEAIKDGHADWKLIWAFLRCVGYTLSDQAPPPERRFKSRRNVDASERRKFKESLERLKRQRRKAWGPNYNSMMAKLPHHILRYPHFSVSVNAGLAHNEVFPWDNYDGPDRRARIPELIKSGKYTRHLRTTPSDPNANPVANPLANPTANPLAGQPANPAQLLNSAKDPKTGALVTPGGHVVAGVVDPPADDNTIPEYLSLFDEVARIPELQRLGTFDKTLSREEIRKRYDAFAKDFRPCEHLRRTLQNLLVNDKVKEEVKAFRSGKNVTTGFGEWLLDEEVAMHTAAVTLAINDAQSIEEGYSVVSPTHAQLCEQVGGHSGGKLVPRALRPGRSLLMPLHSKEHFVLVILQLNAKGSPEISVLDSLFYHYNAVQRHHIFETAWAVACRTGWYRRHFPDEDTFAKVKPSRATWIKAALQPGTNECGYFAILNAWGLALGLELNPAVRLKWTTSFFNELHNVLSLVRLGQADWKLIFAFLRCHDIVRDGSVPESRRFAQTYAIQNDIRMQEILEELDGIEQVHWQERQQLTPEERERLRHCNRVPGLNGRRHNQPGGFPSDQWTDTTRTKYVPRLQRLGVLDIDNTSAEVIQAFKQSFHIPYQRFERIVLRPGGSVAKLTRDELVQRLRHHLENYYTEMEVHYRSYPGERQADTMTTYSRFMKDADVQRHFTTFAVGDITPSKDDYNRLMDDSEVNLAIVSVLEAIDNLQTDLHRRTNSTQPFAGGFALTTSFNLQMAMAPDADDTGAEPMLSRPRRAWLLPVVISKGGLMLHLEKWVEENNVKWNPPKTSRAGGHTFLALVQEVSNDDGDKLPGDTHFEIHFIDSHRQIFEGLWDFRMLCVRNAVRGLGWSTHRNPGGKVTFDSEKWSIPVPQQRPGGWQCGHHTIINAWILALGLHPNEKGYYNNNMYPVIYRLVKAAVTGILDWKTLAQWLVARGLTDEKNVENVPICRRFKSTHGQTSENDLVERIRVYQIDDVALSNVSLTETPYDHPSTNYEPMGDEDEALNRDVEDMDLDVPDHRMSPKRKVRDDDSDGLALWDDVAAGRDGRHAAAADAPRRSKRQRLSNALSFLDLY